MSNETPNEDFFQNFREGLEGFGKRVTSFVDDVMSGEGVQTELRIRVDVYQSADQYVVEVEIPGVKKEDVKIQVQDSVLHIRGNKRPPEGSADHTYDRRERRFGSFSKSIPLPEEVELENIKAKYEGGLLLIRFPRPAPAAEEEDIQID